MEKYQTINIKYPELKIYLKNLQTLSEYDFSNSTYHEIYDKFHDNALILPALGAYLKHKDMNGYRFYRVRLSENISNSEDLTLTNSFSFPPPKVCKVNGRANIKFKSVLYCTDSPFPAMKEARTTIESEGYMGIWELNANRDLNYMSCLPEILPNKNNWKEYGTFHHNFLIEKQAERDEKILAHKIALRKLITDKFMLEKPPYYLSSMIANEYLNYNNADLLLYPSAQTFQDYINFAIQPHVVNKQMRCTKVFKFRITDIIGDEYIFNFLKIGDVKKNKINWRNPNGNDGIELGFNKR